MLLGFRNIDLDPKLSMRLSFQNCSKPHYTLFEVTMEEETFSTNVITRQGVNLFPTVIFEEYTPTQKYYILLL